MTREEAIDILGQRETCRECVADCTCKECDEAFEMAIKALEQEQQSEWERDHEILKAYADGQESMKPCKDAISRQAAIDAIWDGVNMDIYTREVKECLEKLPSVSTEKTGRWECVQYDGNPNIGNWHCSECNRIVCGAITAASPVYSYKYCPNCGARMEV